MEFCSHCDKLRVVNHVLSLVPTPTSRKNIALMSSSSFSKMSSSARQHIFSTAEEFLSLTRSQENNIPCSDSLVHVVDNIIEEQGKECSDVDDTITIPTLSHPNTPVPSVLVAFPFGVVVPLEQQPQEEQVISLKENEHSHNITPASIIMEDLHGILPLSATAYLAVNTFLAFLHKNAYFPNSTNNSEDQPASPTSNSNRDDDHHHIDISAKSGGVPTNNITCSSNNKLKPLVIRHERLSSSENATEGSAKPRSIVVKPGIVISDRYQIQKKIDRGGFSNLFLATDLQSGNGVAVKVANKKLNQTKSLEKEISNYEGLLSLNMGAIPNVHYYAENDYTDYSILVMDLLGPSLEDLLEACNFKFSHGTVASIMSQMLEIFKNFHEIGYLHRDVKPENILVGQLNTQDAHKIYLIDFGVAINWRNMKTGRHVQKEYGLPRTGTNSYMSVNAHRGRTQGRKDDLEALGYCMYRFLGKEFPWTRFENMKDCVKNVVTAKLKSSMNYREEFPPEEYPQEFVKYLEYVQELEFNDEPQYDRLQENFDNLAKTLKEKGEWNGFEWTRPEFFTDSELFQTDKLMRKM